VNVDLSKSTRFRQQIAADVPHGNQCCDNRLDKTTSQVMPPVGFHRTRDDPVVLLPLELSRSDQPIGDSGPLLVTNCEHRQTRVLCSSQQIGYPPNRNDEAIHPLLTSKRSDDHIGFYSDDCNSPMHGEPQNRLSDTDRYIRANEILEDACRRYKLMAAHPPEYLLPQPTDKWQIAIHNDNLRLLDEIRSVIGERSSGDVDVQCSPITDLASILRDVTDTSERLNNWLLKDKGDCGDFNKTVIGNPLVPSPSSLDVIPVINSGPRDNEGVNHVDWSNIVNKLHDEGNHRKVTLKPFQPQSTNKSLNKSASDGGLENPSIEATNLHITLNAHDDRHDHSEVLSLNEIISRCTTPQQGRHLFWIAHGFCRCHSVPSLNFVTFCRAYYNYHKANPDLPRSTVNVRNFVLHYFNKVINNNESQLSSTRFNKDYRVYLNSLASGEVQLWRGTSAPRPQRRRVNIIDSKEKAQNKNNSLSVAVSESLSSAGSSNHKNINCSESSNTTENTNSQSSSLALILEKMAAPVEFRGCCLYHICYGKQAKRCIAPCQYTSLAQNNNLSTPLVEGAKFHKILRQLRKPATNKTSESSLIIENVCEQNTSDDSINTSPSVVGVGVESSVVDEHNSAAA